MIEEIKTITDHITGIEYEYVSWTDENGTHFIDATLYRLLNNNND